MFSATARKRVNNRIRAGQMRLTEVAVGANACELETPSSVLNFPLLHHSLRLGHPMTQRPLPTVSPMISLISSKIIYCGLVATSYLVY